MEAHPVLLELSQRGSFQLSPDGFSGYILWKENRHHERHRIFLTGNPQDLSMDLVYLVDLQYPLEKTPRVRLYVRALQKLVGEEEFTIALKDGFRIEGKTHYDASSVSDCLNMQEVVQFWYTEMGKCSKFFDQVAVMARIAYRLGDKQGTEEYRKLLPTKLAGLALAGMGIAEMYH